jgi:hypothetical protein
MNFAIQPGLFRNRSSFASSLSTLNKPHFTSTAIKRIVENLPGENVIFNNEIVERGTQNHLTKRYNYVNWIVIIQEKRN